MGEVDVQQLAITVARHDVRLADQEDAFDEHCKRQNGSLDKVWAKLNSIDEYQRGEVAHRPTWAVALAITTLVGLVTGLSMALINMASRGG